MFHIEKIIRTLVLSIVMGMLIFCSGCSSVGIGGNPELLTKNGEKVDDEEEREKIKSV